MSGDGKPLISILIPVYNEEGNIERAYEGVLEAFEPLADRYDIEFVFTDNHSTDATIGSLVKLARRDPRVRVFRFSRNVGFQRSIFMGYMHVRGDAAIQLDCDLQDPPELIVRFVEEWERGYEVVYGVRQKRKEGWAITTARRVFYRLINALSPEDLPLDAGDFRLVDRVVVEAIRGIKDVRPYLRGTLTTFGFEQLGIPYGRERREIGESKFSLFNLMSLAFDGIISQSIVPLRLATYIGLSISVVTVCTALFYAVGRAVFGLDWPAGFATTTVLILMSMSINALFLGVIGEYLGRIFEQLRLSPDAFVEYAYDATDGGARGRSRALMLHERGEDAESE